MAKNICSHKKSCAYTFKLQVARVFFTSQHFYRYLRLLLRASIIQDPFLDICTQTLCTKSLEGFDTMHISYYVPVVLKSEDTCWTTLILFQQVNSVTQVILLAHRSLCVLFQGLVFNIFLSEGFLKAKQFQTQNGLKCSVKKNIQPD